MLENADLVAQSLALEEIECGQRLEEIIVNVQLGLVDGHGYVRDNEAALGKACHNCRGG